ncbi:MAG: zinc dependent phospholipase C family protein [Ignavibacteriae bacterium]|nr:zinc dependent phospholipase C family protein [Ignavibacteriota bacterium]
MAGLITHFMACYKARNCKKLPIELRQLLNAHSHWMYLGAASPDLPYAVPFGSQSKWADTMHYTTTDRPVENGVLGLRALWPANRIEDRYTLVWLLGYASHIITDVTVHPVVQAIVGPYTVEANRPPHRECEKVQDSLLFNTIMDGQEITHAEYTDRFRNCAQSAHFDYVMEFWKQLLVDAYPTETPRPEPKTWFKYFRTLMDVADNEKGVTAIFRHAGLGKPGTVVYTKSSELRATQQDQCKKYYDEVKLPGGGVSSFEEVFDRTVRNVCDGWLALYTAMLDNGNIAAVLKEWDLDTGCTADSTTPTLWA